MGVEDSNLQVPTTLGDAGPYVRRVAGTLTGELDALSNKLAPLPETWTGTARDEFIALEQDWNLAARALFGDGVTDQGLLGHIANRLDVAWYNYGLTQSTNTKQWMH